MSDKIGKSRIGTVGGVTPPTHAPGLKCTYPATQAPRPAPSTRIEAERFREGELASKNRGKDGY